MSGSPRFEWDEGNWPKCGKHGVSRAEIERLFDTDPIVLDDPYLGEPRLRAVGRTNAGRNLFVVFALRGGLIRPLSARYMRDKEAKRYVQEAEDLQTPPDG